MGSRPSPVAVLLVWLCALAAPAAAQQIELRPSDTLCLLGSGVAERMQHDGAFEARLQDRFPGLELSVRNLGFAADELTVQQRTAGFGSWDDYLERCGADVILGFFGAMESFAGETGLADFRGELADFIEHVRGLDFGDGPPRLVLVSPTACEDLGDPLLPSAEEQNARLAPYVEAVRAVAARHDVPFVDAFGPLAAGFDPRRPATINGVHLDTRGHALLADVLESSLFGGFDHDPARLEALRRAVVAKNAVWFDRYRATDGYNVYGGRSSLEYDGVTNYEVLQQELVVLDAITAWHDRRIHALARGEAPAPLDVRAGELPADAPPLQPVATNRPGPGPDGAWPFLGGEEALAAMTPADGLAVDLFASEEQFPDLANPVQMSFDPAGRLWVAAWPTYPHWQPGRPMNDKLLVFEDHDGDGRADECTVFADDLHNPTGFELWNGGVLVAAAPDILFLQDTDGDGRADTRERVLGGLSSGDTHHSANSFVLGPGGGLYFQEGIFHRSQVESIRGPVRNRDGCVWRFDPRTWRVERYIPYGFLNPHGHVFDAWGQDFVTDGTGNVNYFALPFSGHMPFPDRHGGYFPFFQQRSRPAAATEIVSSRHLPDAFDGDYLIANVIGFQGVFRYGLSDDGSGFTATEEQPLVHSSDPNFRPVDVEIGPDGAVWLLDWHNPLIGHMQHHLRDPSRDRDHGRVYRVTAPGRPLSRSPRIAGRPVPELVALLAHDEARVRYRTRIELSGRDSREVVAAARARVEELDDARRSGAPDPGQPHHMLEALWLQQQHGVLDQRLLERLLRSDDFRVRAAAVRVLRHMRHQVEPHSTRRPLELLAAAVDDEHPRVRLESVVALSFFGGDPFGDGKGARAAEIALRALDTESDRFLDYALTETLAALEPDWKAALAAGQPFAADQPAGLAWALSRLDTEALADVAPSEARSVEVLTRPGLAPSDHAGALADLAARRETTTRTEWLTAVRRADARTDGHVDHLLSGLFAAAPGDVRGPDATEVLRALAREGRRPSTRRLATAAGLVAEGSVEPAWSEASASLDGLIRLLDAAPLLDDDGRAEGPADALVSPLLVRVRPLMDGPPADLIVEAGDGGGGGIRGRYVRIELPGMERTLTLAEVQVFSEGGNVAPRGTARQSSTNWGGDAGRAVDGNTSGVFGDGGQTHTLEDQPDPWWELDLGATLPIDAVVVWNRTENGWGRRLDGFTLRVLDDDERGGRRTVFEARNQLAPTDNLHVELLPADVRLRRAAVTAFAALGARHDPDDTATELTARLDDEPVRGAVVAGLRALPAQDLSPAVREGLRQRLLRTFARRPEADFSTDAGREVLALADDLMPHLDRAEADQLARLRRRLGPQVIVIRPVRDALLYDRTEFSVVAGRPVELVFDNVDIMPHNLLVTAPGALATVGMAAEAMAADPEAWDRGFVPDRPEVLQATGLLQPGQSQTLTFTAPEDPGDYPYVCTFPGHWVRMNGVMHVVGDANALPAPGVGDPAPPAADPTPPARAFVRTWRPSDLRRHLGGVDSGSATRGRARFEEASCLRCHRIGDDDEEGGATGPPLADVVTRYDRAELLTQILQPSRVLAEGYATEIFVTEDGRVLAGRVLDEDHETVHVQDNPYLPGTVALPKASIARRRTSEVSAMPEELLSTFEQDEILDLLAYLESITGAGSR